MSRLVPLHAVRPEPPGYAAITVLARRRRSATMRRAWPLVTVAGVAAASAIVAVWIAR